MHSTPATTAAPIPRRAAPTARTESLRVRAVSDGRAGIEAQVLGLAEAIGRLTSIDLEVSRVRYRFGVGRLPQTLNLAPRLFLDTPIGPPWPNLWIAAGRATLPLSSRVKRWSGGRTFVVQLQDPRWPLRLFDLVVAPEHDGVSGPNVITTIGAPNRVTPERLRLDAATFRDHLDPLPHPRLAVLVGGRSKAFDLSLARAEELGATVAQAVCASGGSILATFSRRTPQPAKAVLTRVWSDLPGWLWDGEGPNPYFAFLDAADAILVTEDSANMATEAASTGKPVHILPLDGGSPKFARFHDSLRARGAARPFTGDLTPWTYTPLTESNRVAREVLARLAARG